MTISLTGAEKLQRAFFDRLMESQWDAGKQLAMQRTQLEKLLRHARDYVPFYKTRLDPVFRTNGTIDWDRWTEIPILKRADLLEHREAMQARVLPVEYGPTQTFTTTGSTGAPVTTTHNSRAGLMAQATDFRAQAGYGLDSSQPMFSWYGDEELVDAWPDGTTTHGWGPAWDERAKTGSMIRLNRLTAAADTLDFMTRNRVVYLSTRAKWAQILARLAIRSGTSISLKAVLTFGTGITDDERADVRHAFGCEMKALYSSKEAYAMGHECPQSEATHVNPEIVRLEIVDTDGQPVQSGEMGRVVVTPLYSGAQPLIRYDQGDLAIGAGSCSCGTALPVIERIIGRTNHLFRFPDGSAAAPSTSTSLHWEPLQASYGQSCSDRATAS